MRRSPIVLVLASVLLILLASGIAAAQQLATLRVTVTDPSGAIVPGANVTVKDPQTGLTRTASTEANGLAVISALPAGSYELSASSQSFSPRKMPVQLSVGQIASVSVALGLDVRK